MWEDNDNSVIILWALKHVKLCQLLPQGKTEFIFYLGRKKTTKSDHVIQKTKTLKIHWRKFGFLKIPLHHGPIRNSISIDPRSLLIEKASQTWVKGQGGIIVVPSVYSGMKLKSLKASVGAHDKEMNWMF